MAQGTLGGFQLDKAGGAEVLKVLAAQAVTDIAMKVVGGAGPDASISTEVTKTRFVATVTVPASQQAKDGVLSKAVGALGGEVFNYPKSDRQSKKPADPQAPRTRGRPRKTESQAPRKRGRPRKNAAN